MKRKICVVTGTRAEYGLLYWIMKALSADDEITFQLVVTGSHLEEKHGLTKNVILKDGFKIDKEVFCNLASDKPIAIGHSIATALNGMIEAFVELKPDIVAVLGDRFEILSVAQACLVLNIPLAHIHGGEATEGLIDDGIRHSVTKLSHIHFPANLSYGKRIIQMGENPANVFSFGAPGLDNIVNLSLLDKAQLGKELNVEIQEKALLVTYHPITLNENTSNQEIRNLTASLGKIDPSFQIFITMPNADTFSDNIRKEWEEFAKKRPNTFLHVSLGQLRYLSLMNHVLGVVGNSSSGIIEAPFLSKAVVDIGMRQQGRLASPDHVIRVKSDFEEINSALRRMLSDEFQRNSKKPSQLYGDGCSSLKIKEKLKTINLEGIIYKKFYDLNV